MNRIIFLFYNTWLQTYTEKFIKLQVLSFNSLRINSKSTVMLPYIIVLSLISVDPMNILWVSADKRAAMRTTSYPVYRTPVLINLVSLHRTVNIILTIMNGKDDAIENIFFFLVRKNHVAKRLALSTSFLFSVSCFFYSRLYILSHYLNIELR